MKAAVIEEQGGPENIVYRDWPDPLPGHEDVLIHVKACGLNHLDIFVRRGMPGMPVPMPFISGGDIAGIVEAVGDQVQGIKIGARVLLNPSTPDGMMGEQIQGGLAELACCPASHVIPIPSSVTFEQAACLPVAYGTARRMLLTRARLKAGQTVLVLGASGGVGNAAVQIAKQVGARVIACAGSEEKCQRLTQIGADHVINYNQQDFSREAWRLTDKKGVDVVVNFTGGDSWVPSLRAMRKQGRLVTCGATAGFDPKTDIRYIWIRELEILGSDGWTTDDIATLLDDVAAGHIEPIISHVFPLEQARAAEELMEARGIFGKILLVP
ncbi:MAG: zinc-binding dehydrogenase [Alphaproteobacteria bacterium]